MMLTLFMVLMYALIGAYFMRDFMKGYKIHKAALSHFKYGFIPRFTVRELNGRFKANKVGIFYVSTW